MATVLLIGSGGREHALAWKLSQSCSVSRIFVAPGNHGISTVRKVECCDLPLDKNNTGDYDELLKFCNMNGVKLVVIGPEEHLEKGIVEKLEKAGVKSFGPTSSAAVLETSKAFAKDFLQKHGIPTARFKTFTDSSLAIQHIKTCDYKALVVKASGLAAGKGVTVAKNIDEACQAVKEALDEKKFKQAGAEIVVEELLEGQEISALALTDGRIVKMMPFSQDHKRLLKNDQGPNTGGMGAYAPVCICQEYADKIKIEVLQKSVDCMREQEGLKYKGVLYAGIILTKDGPIVLEFNCRFGDPETQVLMHLLKSDLYDVLMSCVNETLEHCQVEWFNDRYAMGVVMASGGYPNNYKTGVPIIGLDDVQLYEPNAVVFHAGTKLAKISSGGQGDNLANSPDTTEDVVTAGGRVVCVTGCGPDLLRARRAVYAACGRISFDNYQYRCDIGAVSLDPPASYASSGVCIESGNELVQRIRHFCASTRRPGSSDIGGFGGAFDLGAAGYASTACVQIAGTDGVGTKLKVAHEYGRHDTVGICLVAMSVNDILVCCAEPLYFLDYFGTSHLNVDTAAVVIKGIADGCKQSGCTLLGGETAEMPGFYGDDEYEIVGMAVGNVHAANQGFPYIDKIVEGDVVLGLASSGLHSNGFSLVRKIVKEMAHLAYSDPCPWTSDVSTTIGDALLVPTKIYVKSLLPVLQANLIKAAAHITGGGLLENIPRVLQRNLSVRLDASKWNIPEIFKWLSYKGRVPASEMCRTFNCGLGMILILSRDNLATVTDRLRSAGETVYEIGHVTAFDKVNDECQVVVKNIEKVFPAFPILYRPPEQKIRVAVLISGTGTNFKALLDHALNPKNNSYCTIACVISNVPSAKGLQYAVDKNIPHKVISHVGKSREVFDDEVDQYLASQNVELVCLAGFMRILSAGFVRKWHGRMLNVHPSLLPSFKGADAVRQALRARVRIVGSTVHFVVPEVDSGAIVCQEATPCRWTTVDEEAQVHAALKQLEWTMYPQAMEDVARGRATLTAEGVEFRL